MVQICVNMVHLNIIYTACKLNMLSFDRSFFVCPFDRWTLEKVPWSRPSNVICYCSHFIKPCHRHKIPNGIIRTMVPCRMAIILNFIVLIVSATFSFCCKKGRKRGLVYNFTDLNCMVG